MKQLAVIILNWNGIDLLRQFLPDAARHTISPEADLIVVDNGSTDGSVEWIRTNCPDVRVISFARNYGFAEGYNRAISQTRYPYTLLLNSDVQVRAGWWQPLLRFMQTYPKAGAAQPKILSFRDPGSFEYAGAAGGYLDNLGYPYCRGRLFDIVERDNGQYDTPPVTVAWASGAALIVRTDLYLQLGGLDPLFFAHMEEIDLCCRIWGAGYEVYAISDSAVYHVGGASLRQGDPKKTYLNFRNNLLLLRKNLPQNRRYKITLRMLTDTLAWLKYLISGDLPNARMVWRAHRDYHKMKKTYTAAPDADYLSTLPGADRSALILRYLKKTPSSAT